MEGNELTIKVPYQTWNALVVRDALNVDMIARFKREIIKEHVRAKKHGYSGSFRCEELADMFGFILPEVKDYSDVEGEQE